MSDKGNIKRMNGLATNQRKTNQKCEIKTKETSKGWMALQENKEKTNRKAISKRKKHQETGRFCKEPKKTQKGDNRTKETSREWLVLQ